MAELIHPNGQTVHTNDPAQIAEFMARGFSAQQGALAQSPGQNIQQIASERGQAWNSQGGQGYLDAMAQGHNDPTSDPRNPQAFTAAARRQYNNGLLTPSSNTGGGLLGGGNAPPAAPPGTPPGGAGMGGGFPASTLPIFSNVGNIAGAQPPSAMPTIGASPDGQQLPAAPQSFEDLLSKYSTQNAPLNNGAGFNWMTPSTTPGQVNVMDANLSRRYL